MRRHSAGITLTAKQITLLQSIIDSFQDGRAMREGHSSHIAENSSVYRDEDKFCEVLIKKLQLAEETISRRVRMDNRLAHVRDSLGIGRKR